MLPHVQCADRFAGRPNLVPSCPATHHAGLRSPGLRLHILRNDPFVGAGMRMDKAHSPNILLNLLRASAARTRDSFPFTRKGIKGVPKRRYPLWKHLWRGRPHLCFLHCPTFLCAVSRMKLVSFSELFHNKDTPSGTSLREVLSPCLLH